MSTDIRRLEPGLAPLDQNPAAVYLSSLAQSGRRTMQCKLERAARLLGHDDTLAAPWGDLRFQHVAALRTRMVDEGLAPSTINQTLSAIRSVASAAFNLGLLGGDDLERIRSVKPVRGERLPSGRALATREIAAIIGTCADAGGVAGTRDAAIIGTMYTAGLRRQEVVDIDLADLDLPRGELLVHGKGNRERLLFVTGGAADAVEDWLKLRGDGDGPLFCPVGQTGEITIRRLGAAAIYKMLQKRGKQAGVDEFSPHDLRRTFVSDLLDAGADVLTVQKLAGHANVQTTGRYDRRDDEAKRLAAGKLFIPYGRHSLPIDGSREAPNAE